MLHEQTEEYRNASLAEASCNEAINRCISVTVKLPVGHFERMKLERAKKWLYAARKAIVAARDEQVLL